MLWRTLFDSVDPRSRLYGEFCVSAVFCDAVVSSLSSFGQELSSVVCHEIVGRMKMIGFLIFPALPNRSDTIIHV
jgi:hypothetical protein